MKQLIGSHIQVNSHPPHHRSALRAMFVAATEGYPEPVEDKGYWSVLLQDFIKHCVVKDPKARWTVDQLKAHEFVAKKTDTQTMSSLFTRVFS